MPAASTTSASAQPAAVAGGMLLPTMAGPRVHAQRGQSADAGGGVIGVLSGVMQIQGPVRSRRLGAMQDLRSVVFRDRQGRDATLTFGDGTAWRLEGDAGGELLKFMLEIEQAMATPGLVQQAPPLRESLRASITPQVRRDAGGVVAALALGWLVSILVRVWSPLGYVVVAVLVAATVAAVVGRLESAPPVLARLWRWCESSPVIAVALVVGLSGGVWRGLSAAAVDEARAEQRAAELAAQEQQERTRQEAEQRARDAVQARVPTLLADLRVAMEQKDWVQAKRLHDALLAIDSDLPGATSVGPMIAERYAEQQEQLRRDTLSAAVGRAAAVVADRLRCESASDVAGVWKGLSAARESDPEWSAAQALLPKLEACRRRVAEGYASKTADSRKMMRGSAAAALERSLRERGWDVTVKWHKRDDLVLQVQFEDITEEWIDDLVDRGSLEAGTFLRQWQDHGVRRVELGDRAAVVRRYALSPESTRDASRQVLSRFGLAEPLRFGGPVAAQD